MIQLVTSAPSGQERSVLPEAHDLAYETGAMLVRVQLAGTGAQITLDVAIGKGYASSGQDAWACTPPRQGSGRSARCFAPRVDRIGGQHQVMAPVIFREPTLALERVQKVGRGG